MQHSGRRVGGGGRGTPAPVLGARVLWTVRGGVRGAARTCGRWEDEEDEDEDTWPWWRGGVLGGEMWGGGQAVRKQGGGW